jgi:hypothetical protein
VRDTEFKFEGMALFRHTVIIVLGLPIDTSLLTLWITEHMGVLGLKLYLTGCRLLILDLELADNRSGKCDRYRIQRTAAITLTDTSQFSF